MKRTLLPGVDDDAIVNLPVDVLLEIFSHLGPEDAKNAYSITKQIKDSKTANQFWEYKFRQHFPHIFLQNKNKFIGMKNINWYNEFRKTYTTQYKDLSPTVKKLFSLAKESNFLVLENIKFADLFQRDEDDLSLFYWIRKCGNQAMLDQIYKLAIDDYKLKDSNIDDLNLFSGMSILHFAILCHQPGNIIIKLIEHGADINATTAINLSNKNAFLEFVNVNGICYMHYGLTPMHIAADQGCNDIVNILLAKQANHDIYSYQVSKFDPSSTSRTITPLNLAVKMGHIDIVKALLDKGAKSSLYTFVGAVKNRQASAISMLLEKEYRGNMMATINFDKLVNVLLKKAIKLGDTEIVKILENAIAKSNLFGQAHSIFKTDDSGEVMDVEKDNNSRFTKK